MEHCSPDLACKHTRQLAVRHSHSPPLGTASLFLAHVTGSVAQRRPKLPVPSGRWPSAVQAAVVTHELALKRSRDSWHSEHAVPRSCKRQLEQSRTGQEQLPRTHVRTVCAHAVASDMPAAHSRHTDDPLAATRHSLQFAGQEHARPPRTPTSPLRHMNGASMQASPRTARPCARQAAADTQLPAPSSTRSPAAQRVQEPVAPGLRTQAAHVLLGQLHARPRTLEATSTTMPLLQLAEPTHAPPTRTVVLLHASHTVPLDVKLHSLHPATALPQSHVVVAGSPRAWPATQRTGRDAHTRPEVPLPT